MVLQQSFENLLYHADRPVHSITFFFCDRKYQLSSSLQLLCKSSHNKEENQHTALILAIILASYICLCPLAAHKLTTCASEVVVHLCHTTIASSSPSNLLQSSQTASVNTNHNAWGEFFLKVNHFQQNSTLGDRLVKVLYTWRRLDVQNSGSFILPKVLNYHTRFDSLTLHACTGPTTQAHKLVTRSVLVTLCQKLHQNLPNSLKISFPI